MRTLAVVSMSMTRASAFSGQPPPSSQSAPICPARPKESSTLIPRTLIARASAPTLSSSMSVAFSPKPT